jgi:hypothetical protein
MQLERRESDLKRKSYRGFKIKRNYARNYKIPLAGFHKNTIFFLPPCPLSHPGRGEGVGGPRAQGLSGLPGAPPWAAQERGKGAGGTVARGEREGRERGLCVGERKMKNTMTTMVEAK